MHRIAHLLRSPVARALLNVAIAIVIAVVRSALGV